MLATTNRLRKHADFQRVYQAGRKQFARNIAYFYALRQLESPPPAGLNSLTTSGPRIGLTVPKALGKAAIRNRIKRRLREAIRHALPLLHAPVDLVLHPRRIVIEMEFTQLEREVAGLFRSVQAACDRVAAKQQSAKQTDLSHTDLSHTDLSHTDLSHTDLSQPGLNQPGLKQPAPPATEVVPS